MNALSQILRDGSHPVGVASCVVAVWTVVGQGGLLKNRSVGYWKSDVWMWPFEARYTDIYRRCVYVLFSVLSCESSICQPARAPRAVDRPQRAIINNWRDFITAFKRSGSQTDRIHKFRNLRAKNSDVKERYVIQSWSAWSSQLFLLEKWSFASPRETSICIKVKLD